MGYSFKTLARKSLIQHFLFFFFQDSTSLPTIMVLEESEVSSRVKEEARVSVERFLQVKRHQKKMYRQINT